MIYNHTGKKMTHIKHLTKRYISMVLLVAMFISFSNLSAVSAQENVDYRITEYLEPEDVIVNFNEMGMNFEIKVNGRTIHGGGLLYRLEGAALYKNSFVADITNFFLSDSVLLNNKK